MTWIDISNSLRTADQNSLLSLYKAQEGIMLDLDKLEEKAKAEKVSSEEIEKISDRVRDELQILWYALDQEYKDILNEK